jgi:hypothetical protein|tara:strand:+ start:22 stop:144 length:123 start_codon:yes stop_codon:yes gene_type:complete
LPPRAGKYPKAGKRTPKKPIKVGDNIIKVNKNKINFNNLL